MTVAVRIPKRTTRRRMHGSIFLYYVASLVSTLRG